MSKGLELGFDGSICVVDVETTGLDPSTDRVISVAAFRLDMDDQPSGQLTGETMTILVDPEHPIHPKATAVNGYRNRDLKGKPVFADEAEELRAFIGALPLVGHNVSFDKRFLSAEFKRAGVKTLHRNRPACTMEGISDLMYSVGRHGAKWDRLSLDRACSLFQVGGRKGKHHEALEDVLLTAQLAQRLRELALMPKGQAKAEIRRLVQNWPEEAGRRERYAAPARERRTDRAAPDTEGVGCGAMVGWVVGLLLLVAFVSSALG